jgi:hypothetical protein
MMMNTNAMSPTASTDADFSFGPLQPYVGFDVAGMGMPSVVVERSSSLLQHNTSSSSHNNNLGLYDSFDFAAAAGLPFQESGLLPPASLPLAPSPPSMAAMAMPPSSLLLTLPGVPAAADVVYNPFGGGGAGGFLKREDGGPLVDAAGGGGRIGLNLGRRTYFSPADVLAVDRLLTRSRLAGGGVGVGLGMGLGMGVLGLGAAHHQQPPPRCQAEGCKADLSAAKHYHRRHKVCEYHAKASAVAAAGKQQRFCQQCSRYVRTYVSLPPLHACMHACPALGQVARLSRHVPTAHTYAAGPVRPAARYLPTCVPYVCAVPGTVDTFTCCQCCTVAFASCHVRVWAPVRCNYMHGTQLRGNTCICTSARQALHALA